MRTLAGIGLVFAAAIPAAAESTALTIYSTARPGAVSADSYRPLPGSAPRSHGGVPGYAVVKHQRSLALEKGRNSLRFSDVAAHIDPTTVRFTSLTAPDSTRVLEQNYQFDLVSRDSLIRRYIDREIVVEQTRGETVELIRGKLLSADGGLTLEIEGGRVRTLNSWSGIELPELPGGLITRPTLVWDVEAKRGGRHDTRVSYQTRGVTWWADYNLVFSPGDDANSGTLDVGAWVSILNQSGASYDEARLKLVAGDVHRAQPSPVRVDRFSKVAMAEADSGFQEKAFFEYHLYTLGRPTTLPSNSTKQIELFDASTGVPAAKELVYRGVQGSWGVGRQPLSDRGLATVSNAKVEVFLRFDNEERSGLGIPLPSGRVRVNQVDPDDGSLEFIGEDVIDHTPRDETVRIRLGNAFDVVGERRQTDFSSDSARKRMEESVEIVLRNRKEQAVEVTAREALFRWSRWRIVEASHDWEKLDAQTIEFPVEIPAGEEVSIRYRVEYAW